jgi:UDP-N-acetylmuramate dehydrogenase
VSHDLFAARAGAAVPADRIQRHAPLAPLTTFGVGGAADWLVDVRTGDELAAVLAAAREASQPVTILGGGSNVLVSDAGVRGVVLRVQLRDIAHTAPDRVRAGGGLTINGLVRWTISHGLAGVEAWAGTPGTVGGAIYGNAHFQGRDIGELLAAVHLCAPDGRLATVPASEMGFAYDTSRLSKTHEIVIWAEFVVSRGAPDVLRATARESLAYRKRTQPLAMPSAGCIFQNPDPVRDSVPPGVPASAGALIDRAGCKGHRIGGAVISPHHANFIVNDGGARAADVRALIERARGAVRDRFGVDLRLEVVLLGDWPGT